MENYVYAFKEPNAADEIVNALMVFASWLPDPYYVTKKNFGEQLESIMKNYTRSETIGAGSFIKVEYYDDYDQIVVFKISTVFHVDAPSRDKIVFNVINNQQDDLEREAVAQKIFEDTVGYDEKNLIDIEKIKEFYEKCEKKFEEYEKTGGWEPFTPSSNDQSIKSDAGKLRLTLVPPEIIRAIARARMYGLKKYGDKESWRSVSEERYKDALCRHILLYLEDPDGVDEESGLSHLDHVACNVAFLCELKKENKKKKEKLRVCGYCKHCICGDIDMCELDGSYISFWQAAICSKFEPKEGQA